MKLKSHRTWFTLVELIVVITILTILWTIAFISLQWFSLDARDSARINDVKVIEKWLSFHKTKWNPYPNPDNSIEVTSNSTILSYQWEVWSWVLRSIAQAGDIRDPLLKEPYTYALSADKASIQLLAYFEKNQLSFVSEPLAIWLTTSAQANYNQMYAKSYWNKIGILTQLTDNQPLNARLAWSSDVDIQNFWWNEYRAYVWNEIIQWDEEVISGIIPNASCKRILEVWDNTWDGLYTISPYGSSSFEVYCDMTTDWGGWTLVWKSWSGQVSQFWHLDGTVWNNTEAYASVTLDNWNFWVNESWESLFQDFRLCRGQTEKCLKLSLDSSYVKESCDTWGLSCEDYEFDYLSLRDIFEENISVWKFEDQEDLYQLEAEKLWVWSITRWSRRNWCWINIWIRTIERRARLGCAWDVSSYWSYDDSSIWIGISSCPNGGCRGEKNPNYATYLYWTQLLNRMPDPEVNYIWIR